MGIVAREAHRGSRPHEAEPESITSFHGSPSRGQASRSQLNESYEESIAEDISDGDQSIPEDCGSSSQRSSPVHGASAAETPSMLSHAVGTNSSWRSSSGGSVGINGNSTTCGKSSSHIVGIVSGAGDPEASEVQESMLSVQTGSPSVSKHRVSDMQRKPRERSMRDSTISSIQESLPSGGRAHCEESIIEEVSDEDVSVPKLPVRALDSRSGIPPRTGSPGPSSRACRPSSQATSQSQSQSSRRIRPVSGSSVRSSSLTPMN